MGFSNLRKEYIELRRDMDSLPSSSSTYKKTKQKLSDLLERVKKEHGQDMVDKIVGAKPKVESNPKAQPAKSPEKNSFYYLTVFKTEGAGKWSASLKQGESDFDKEFNQKGYPTVIARTIYKFDRLTGKIV